MFGSWGGGGGGLTQLEPQSYVYLELRSLHIRLPFVSRHPHSHTRSSHTHLAHILSVHSIHPLHFSPLLNCPLTYLCTLPLKPFFIKTAAPLSQTPPLCTPCPTPLTLLSDPPLTPFSLPHALSQRVYYIRSPPSVYHPPHTLPPTPRPL